jgi:hypothetical protein
VPVGQHQQLAEIDELAELLRTGVVLEDEGVACRRQVIADGGVVFAVDGQAVAPVGPGVALVGLAREEEEIDLGAVFATATPSFSEAGAFRKASDVSVTLSLPSGKLGGNVRAPFLSGF